MTDQTVGMHLHGPARQAVASEAPRAGRGPGIEFRVYFALILMLAIPFSLIGWIAHVLRHGTLPARGPLGRAVAEARVITPLIFSA